MTFRQLPVQLLGYVLDGLLRKLGRGCVPDSNNPLETALRRIFALAEAANSHSGNLEEAKLLPDTSKELSKSAKKYIRAELINFRNLEVQASLDYWAGRTD